MKWHRHAFVEHIPDAQHRQSNDICLGLSDARYMQRACFDLGIFNIKYGPWLKSGFAKLLIEVAAEVSAQMDCNDQVLLHFYPLILADRGDPPEMNTEQNRKEFLESLPWQPWVVGKGPKASLARFNSWYHAFAFWDKFWSAQTFLLVVCSLRNGWSRYADEFWAPAKQVVEDSSAPSQGASGSVAGRVGVGGPQVGGGAPERPAQGGASSNSSSSSSALGVPVSNAEPAPRLTKAAARVAAKVEMNELRAKSQNTLHSVARAMADPDILADTRIIGYALEVEAKSSGMMLKDLRGEGDTLLYFINWFYMSWVDGCKAQLLLLRDMVELERIGMQVNIANLRGSQNALGASVAWDDVLALRLHKVVFNQVKRKAGSMMWHVYGAPGTTAGLLSEDQLKVTERLRFLKDCKASFDYCDSHKTALLQEMVKGQGLTSPLMSWLMTVLGRVQFKHVPPVLAGFLREFWGGHAQLQDQR